jgi:cyclopropane fatty-acyl-phospholipid synthase-like methyltransferase
MASSATHALSWDRFPRSSRYDPECVFANNMGPNVLWLTEWLTQAMHLERGMRVLDMGCGKAVVSQRRRHDG